MKGKVLKNGLKGQKSLRLSGLGFCVRSDTDATDVDSGNLDLMMDEVQPKNFVKKNPGFYCGFPVEKLVPVELKEERHKYVRRNSIFLFPTE